MRSKSVWGFLTAGPRRAGRQSHAALELLEKFRHGPETHSEWNLLLWRATFPLVSLVLLTLLCIAGQFGHAAYSLVVNPVWYLCNFALVTTPFLLVFRFSSLDENEATDPQANIWYVLAAISAAISLIEWCLSMPASKYSWIVGNTLFGIVSLVAVPLYFSTQHRTSRSQYEALVMQENEQDFMQNVAEERKNVFEESWRSRHELNETVTMTRLLYGCGFCALVLWLVMFMSYSSAQEGGAATSTWFPLYLLSPFLCIVLFYSRGSKLRFSYEHAVAYSTLVVHIPLFLGHLCVRLFAMAEDPATSSPTTRESWLKLAISVIYLLMMQSYFFVITHMVHSMSEPFAHPSLLYVGQLYYYVYWYILVGTDTPIDALYWAMLLLNNIHIAFLNTGIYTDFKRVSSVWLETPLHVDVCTSMSVCLRTTLSAVDGSRCLWHRRLHDRQSLLRLNCGVVGAAAMESQSEFLEGADSESEHSYSDSSNEFLVTQIADAKDPIVDLSQLPSWRDSGSRNRDRVRGMKCIRRVAETSTNNPLPPQKTNSRKPLCFSKKCTPAHTNYTKRNQSSRSSIAGVSSALSTAHFDARIATSDALKPLYYLMKLAEQDNMADTTALILVPSLLTLLAVFEKPGSAFVVLQDQTNLWLRCVCMFIGRLGGAFLAREIFTCKLRSRLRMSNEDVSETAQSTPVNGSIDGMPARLWIQHLMLQDFHAHFWYLTAVTIVVTFGCFARIELPLRFALL
ncbi:hypothetical protein CCR75_004038 [Bremia lactucae]|uniref:Transmembrane protein n=1 Tax=Bremia lactucae TaxID=4779 RepID=A0A976FFT5_BRELC|nr:hypothetical protein CCR75_004038 [Bremia lactucae]